ncbi:hypothetical protein T08_11146 [Trichinella sp. T8]|nr:hypothetical protein T08_11146 [Trichinella sp. T8]
MKYLLTDKTVLAEAVISDKRNITEENTQIVKNEYSPGQHRRFSAIFEPFHHVLLVVFLLPQLAFVVEKEG